VYFTVTEQCEAVSVPAAHTARLDRASVADRRLTRAKRRQRTALPNRLSRWRTARIDGPWRPE